MYEVLVIFTLFAPEVQPKEQFVEMPDCEVVKARIEAVWAETAPPGFYGTLTCEKRKREKKKEEKKK